MRRPVVLSIAVVAVLALVVPARAGLVTHERCPGAPAATSVWKRIGPPQGPGDVLENLGFDELGGLWIANSTKGRIERYDATGTLRDHVAVAAPGAITRGPDGLLYVNVGAGAAGALLRTGAAGVVRFDPAVFPAQPSVFVGGPENPPARRIHMANGGIFDAAGNYYLSNDFDHGLVKVRPDGTVDEAWSDAADVWGTNGLVVAGDVLYAAITFDQRSPIERIPLAAPHAHVTAVETTFGVVSAEPRVYTSPATTTPLVGLKGLDDMTLGPDGRLYVTANGMGELLRVDLASGEVCVVADGLVNPSSVRFARGFGAFDPARDLFVTEFSGAIRHVRLG